MKYTKEEAITELKRLGWKRGRGRWIPPQKCYTAEINAGVTLREACSLELLETERLP